MIGILLALASAIGYGVSDFVGGIASRRVAALRVVLVSYPLAMVLLGILAVVVGGTVSTPAVVWGLLCGVSQAFGVWWFYAALGSGPISVVSPVTAVLVAAVPVSVGLAMGERPGAIAGVGTVLALIAVVLVSRQATDEDVRPHKFTATVAWLTIGSGLAFGLNFVLLHQAPADARLWPLFFARVSATAIVVLAAALSGNLHAPRGFPLKMAVVAALLDTVSNVATLLALQATMLSLASVLMALYPAATVLLAIVVLRERVTRWQVLGMVMALVAVGMISVR
ncbi:DMT family transporter [Mycolicibacterium aichiense]|uniref:DMT family transporter n=1 Tax=Mycolicibacterium aichiense TaxID=1799 RepID=UPI0015595AF2|nr:DMT family transporter [Mycolicibacterium aichiense]MCV7017660.1 DMT family transporter [Mycolicibacterium aichiense]